MNKRLTVSVLSIAVFIFSATAQQKDSSQRGKADTLKAYQKTYRDLIGKTAKTSIGFFNLQQVGEKWYIEIPTSLFDRELLIVNRIARGGAGLRASMTGYAGDEINENSVAFTKGPGNKLFLSLLSHSEVSKDSSENGLFKAVRNSSLQPLAASFEIKAWDMDSSAAVIDVTDFVNSDNDILFFDPSVKKILGLGGYAADRSYTESIHAFAGNIEIKTIKTYMRSVGGPTGPGAPVPATLELNSSILLLPLHPMQPRYYDDRVGFFATDYKDFDINPQGVGQTAMITRWRLEPKDPAAYLRGDLTDPVKPIIYFIDPSTPKKWIPYLIQGVNDWNAAFEQAGFKNAIIAKEAPLSDSSWDIDDASHSAIVYKPSDIPNASGPHVHDPRSGEILETHINWYHSVMDLLHNWYLIQAAATDPRARKPVFDDSLMGQLIRFVVSHEVGHTLGLRHNFGSSSTVPVDSLRSEHFLTLNGHTPSIMDYARFDYVAQPEDHISEQNLFPRIGAYDKWAIEWGYRWFPDKETREREQFRMNKWVIEKTTSNPSLWFGTESDPDDPRCQNEDVGDDAVKAGQYGIKNLQRILPELKTWTKQPAHNYDNLKKMYGELTGQFERYMGHVAKNIGGIMTTPKTVEQNGTVVQFVSKRKQQEAMQFLQTQLFNSPLWIADTQILLLTGSSFSGTLISLQTPILYQLLSDNTLAKLQRYTSFEPAVAYKASAMLEDLQKGIWSELYLHQQIPLHRRNLQKAYTERLISLLTPMAPPGQTNPVKLNDELSLLKDKGKQLLQLIKASVAETKDNETRIHLADCAQRLEDALYPNK